ncbi:hypothetical protein C8N43_1386 [Litoreibacter ponti]|uniref:Uncharacterized protein n=1 Tax=Litoreibacter ponti TaxID=1510457 RepID=A0A2T6BKY1_9RHOB|nr:hypothetical protein C8N43_1386 [Litoreibacter ponti]
MQIARLLSFCNIGAGRLKMACAAGAPFGHLPQ